jgi:hypothetical protein
MITEEQLIAYFGGLESNKILSAKTISRHFNITKRKCHGLLYRAKSVEKVTKVKDIAAIGCGTRRGSLWRIKIEDTSSDDE